MQEALEETSRVRVEFGYPIMVTPLSQFVGSQAAINVIVGERYKEVTDQVDPLCARPFRRGGGHRHGPGGAGEDSRPPARAGDHGADARASEHRRYAARLSTRASISDEELLLRWLLTREDIAAMRATGPAKPYVTTRHPLVKLMAELMQSANGNLIQVSKPGFSLKLERKAVHS